MAGPSVPHSRQLSDKDNYSLATQVVCGRQLDRAGAIHAVPVQGGPGRFVTSGNGIAVIQRGKYAGDPVTTQHRYMSGTGSWNPYVLVSPAGKQIKMLGEFGDDTGGEMAALQSVEGRSAAPAPARAASFPSQKADPGQNGAQLAKSSRKSEKWAPYDTNTGLNCYLLGKIVYEIASARDVGMPRYMSRGILRDNSHNSPELEEQMIEVLESVYNTPAISAEDFRSMFTGNCVREYNKSH
jgi:hypothetical protein